MTLVYFSFASCYKVVVNQLDVIAEV